MREIKKFRIYLEYPGGKTSIVLVGTSIDDVIEIPFEKLVFLGHGTPFIRQPKRKMGHSRICPICQKYFRMTASKERWYIKENMEVPTICPNCLREYFVRIVLKEIDDAERRESTQTSD